MSGVDQQRPGEDQPDGGNDILAAEFALGVLPPEDQAALARRAETDPAFALPIVIGVLRTAADEYEAAFEGESIANPVEYQDSLGFARVANASVELLTPSLTAKDADAANTLRQEMNTLLQAWPSVMPERKAAMSAAEVSGLVSRIEFASARLR